jgi:hypothetical protein
MAVGRVVHANAPLEQLARVVHALPPAALLEFIVLDMYTVLIMMSRPHLPVQ